MREAEARCWREVVRTEFRQGIPVQMKVQEFVETEEDASANRHPEEQTDGSFSLVLPESDELNISALDRAALDVSFPALREALSQHLAQAGKKNSGAKLND